MPTRRSSAGSVTRGPRPARSSTWASPASVSRRSRTCRWSSSVRQLQGSRWTTFWRTTRLPADDDGPMRFALMSEPQQGLSYDEILALADTAEDAGLEAFFRSDHYTSFPGEAGLPTTDAWATLAGLARDTERIHIGTLVSPATFRLPGPFAKMVATVDEMSGGRVELGMGAGWNEREHAELGIPFPSLKERFDRLEES